MDAEILHRKRDIGLIPDILEYLLERILDGLVGNAVVHQREIKVLRITVVLEIEFLEHRATLERQRFGQHIIRRHAGKNPSQNVILLNLGVTHPLLVRFLLNFSRPYHRINCLSR